MGETAIQALYFYTVQGCKSVKELTPDKIKTVYAPTHEVPVKIHKHTFKHIQLPLLINKKTNREKSEKKTGINKDNHEMVEKILSQKISEEFMPQWRAYKTGLAVCLNYPDHL